VNVKLIDRAVLAGALEVFDHGYTVDGVVTADIVEAEGLPGGSGGDVVRFRGEIDRIAAPVLCLAVYVGHQGSRETSLAVLRVGHNVLGVHVIGVVLAAEGDDRASHVAGDEGQRDRLRRTDWRTASSPIRFEPGCTGCRAP
jgi:hypothetical protein